MVNQKKVVEGEMEPAMKSAAQDQGQGQVQQPPMSTHHHRNHRNAFHPLLGQRSSWVYSLTLDEFQHALIGSGRNFGSMNMNEFLAAIFAAEEHAQPQPATAVRHIPTFFMDRGSSSSTVPDHFSFPKQNFINIPSLLSQKTVQEVWLEILKIQKQHNDVNSQKQPTLGKTTLENFLAKAGAVSEQSSPPVQVPVPVSISVPSPLTWYNNNNKRSPVPIPTPTPTPTPNSTYATMNLDGPGNIPPYQNLSHGPTPESSSIGYPAVSPYNNMNGMGTELSLTVPFMPINPVLADEMQGGNPSVRGGSNRGVRGRRNRNIDGSVERVVERRQRRMIRNRESAARSRARTQAYTMGLETELIQLKEENSQLKQAWLGQKNSYLEKIRVKASQNRKDLTVTEKLRLLQRSMSGHF